jgi:hypothetical protein
MVRAFLFCEACGEVAREGHPTPGFAADADEPTGRPAAFRLRHARHGVRRLLPSGETFVSEEAYGAVSRLAFHAARDDRGAGYVVEARRPAPGLPVSYRSRRGALLQTRRAIGVDRAGIARVLGEATGASSDASIGEAAARLARLVGVEAEAAGFAALEARAVAGPTPLLAHAPLPDAGLPRLFDAARGLAAAGRLAGPRALSPRRLAALVEAHAGPGGAFAPTLETGYTLVGPSGRAEGYLRRVRAREAR